jgi:ribosomal protein S10
MLIKKNLKKKEFAFCSILLKSKNQSFPPYPICKKQNRYQIASPQLPSFLSPKIEQVLLKSLSCQLSTKRQVQKKKKTLNFLYPIDGFNFQRKHKVSRRFTTGIANFTLVSFKKEKNLYAPFALPLEKRRQLKIVLKSYSNQFKDIQTSIVAISELLHYLNRLNAKQFKKFLINSFYLASFGLYSSFLSQFVKIKNLNNSNNCFSEIPSILSLPNNSTNTLKFSPQKNQKAKRTQIALNLNLLMKQPLIEFLGKSSEIAIEQHKDQSAFLLSALQKTNNRNRHFFKSSVFLDSNGPIGKQIQKISNSTQLFTVARSPFVFKKTREQFIKQEFSYIIKIKLHSPIQKQLFIQCISLLRLPVELEIHC